MSRSTLRKKKKKHCEKILISFEKMNFKDDS